MPSLRIVAPNTPVRVASVEDVDEMSESWSDEVLACRSGFMSHNFGPYDAVLNKRYKYWRVTLRCPRCTTRKMYDMTIHGVVLNTWYNHPPGYLSKKGRILGEGKELVRVKAVERLFTKHVLNNDESKEDIPRESTQRKLAEVTPLTGRKRSVRTGG